MDELNKTNEKTDYNKNITYKNIIGFFIIYVVVVMIIPYFLFEDIPKFLFLTYFANVDIISNILTIHFPSYFKNIYDINPKTPVQYISYNTISIIALSGIFMYGLSQKNRGFLSDLDILFTMMIMTVITWVLPTKLIPYLTEKIKQFFQFKYKDADIFIATTISICFILIEAILIHLWIRFTGSMKKDFFKHFHFKFY